MLERKLWWIGTAASVLVCVLLLTDLFAESGSLKALAMIPWTACATICFLGATRPNV